MACFRLREYEIAVEHLKTASLMSSSRSSNLLVHYYLGRGFEALGCQDQAKKAFRIMGRFRKGLDELNKHFGGWSKSYPEVQLVQNDIINIEQLLSNVK